MRSVSRWPRDRTRWDTHRASGIWQPQGTVLDAALAFEEGQIVEPSVLYEAGAQILVGSVFKMWYSSGYTTPTISYAESYDGIAWAKHPANPIIADHTRCCILKNGAAYIMFALKGGVLDKLSSADGVTWALDNAGVLGDGPPGAWDDGWVGNTHAWIEDATWYMLYDATDGARYYVGLATSPDGVVWTKSPSNPVITFGVGSIGGPWVIKTGSWYYVWCQVSSPGLLPTDVARYRSRDLINWKRDPSGLVLPRIGRDEGAGIPDGQTADVAGVEVGGTTYMFVSVARNGAQALQHIKLVTAQMSLAKISETDEGIARGYKPEKLYNTSLERLGGVDIFQDWLEGATDGAIARTTTAGEFRAGTSGIAAVKLTAGPLKSTQIRQALTLAAGDYIPGLVYAVTGWARGDGIHGGRVRIFGAADLVDFNTTGTEPGVVFAPFSFPFLAPNTPSISFYFYCPNTNGGIAYFDDISVKEV